MDSTQRLADANETAEAHVVEKAPPARNTNHSANPPKPPLVLHVGVVGHRPDATKRPMPDEAAVRAVLREVLRCVKATVNGLAAAKADLFSLVPGRGGSENGSILRIVSCLADGADQWVADEALRLGFELQSPIPFDREEYAKDFDGAASGEFRRLLGKAEAVLELDGCRKSEDRSYEAAGRLVLSQSDLLVALWDGLDEMGRGGTGQMVREALHNGVPVIWIRWVGASQWQLLDAVRWRLVEDADELKGESARLAAVITDLLLPPDLRGDRRCAGHEQSRERYYRERQRRWTILGPLWRFLRGLVLLKSPQWTWRLAPYVDDTKNGWDKEWAKCTSSDRDLVGRIDQPHQAHYAWANQSSMYYGSLHRSSTVLNYCLGVVAVLCALLGIPAVLHGKPEVASILLELAAIGIIIFLTIRGSIGRWHERWIDYRILAERLRVSRFLMLLGGARQHFSMPGHLGTYGNPATTWVYWHYRAVTRAAGLPDVRLDTAHLAAIQAVLRDVFIQGQIDYHQENARALATIDQRLHRLANGLFIATFIACTIHASLIVSLKTVPTWAGVLLITLNALLPAIGAALAAMRSQGEFHRIAQRSQAMREELEGLKLILSRIPSCDGELNSQEMRQVVEQAARLMVNETLDWRIVFQDRPLGLPA